MRISYDQRAMRILFDQGTPVPLRRHLLRHSVMTAYEQGWASLANGQLLDAAEQEGFDVLVTTDQNLQYQQSLSDRRIAIVVLRSTSWPRIQNSIPAVCAAIFRASIGTYEEVEIPPAQ